LVLVEMSYQYS